MAMGANHTKSDIAVFVEPDRVLVAGDLVMMGLPQFTAPTARIATWLGTLDRFDALKPVRIVPSHGAMGDAIDDCGLPGVPHHRARAGRGVEEGRQDDRRDRPHAAGRAPGRYNRNQMASAIRAAYNEAQ